MAQCHAFVREGIYSFSPLIKMKAKPLPSQERLRELLDYDQETGVLTWKVKPAKQIKVGDVAGSLNGHGYLATSVDGARHRNHRLIWMWMTGDDPGDLQVDHINRNPSDNRWENLRLATHSQNMSNTHRSDNTSGIPGVTWFKSRKKWRVQLRVNGKTKHVGYFSTKIEACAALIKVANSHHIIHQLEIAS